MSIVSLVGFTGSRDLPARHLARIQGIVKAVIATGRSVAVGDAAGTDSMVILAAPANRRHIFSVYAYPGQASTARRSIAMVRAVAASGPGRQLVGFPVRPCPSEVRPSPNSSKCFCGAGSGTWATLALAAGLGIRVTVFSSAWVPLPRWGEWIPAVGEIWAGCWHWKAPMGFGFNLPLL